jgi:DEAD/DEAH box helicase domain-containing protein
LTAGTRLVITEVDGKITSVSTEIKNPGESDRSRPSEKSSVLPAGVYTVTVTKIAVVRGIVSIMAPTGISLSLRLPVENPNWAKLRVGQKIELEVTFDQAQNPKYALSLEPRPQKPAVQVKAAGPVPNQPPAKPFAPIPTSKPGASTPVLPQPKKVGGDRPAEPARVKPSETPVDSEKIEAESFGIDRAYFHEREKENHRHEIMAFLREHLNDNLIEWYQMRPERFARLGEPRQPLTPAVAAALKAADANFSRFYIHQARSLDAIRSGKNLVVVTQTASGKTLCYNPAIFEHFSTSDPSAHALYVFPLNALMTDQKEKIDQLNNTLRSLAVNISTEMLRGGLPPGRRQAIASESPNIVATNPEMLGVVLGEWRLWQDFLAGLRYIVIDEVHSYRGILGMHMAGILRRLLLITRRLGNTPQFILSSATVTNPLELASRLTSLPESSFDLLSEEDDGSQQKCKHWVVLNPDAHNEGGSYDNYLTTAAMAMVDLLCARDKNHQASPLNTILFAKSMRDVKKAYNIVQENLKNRNPALAAKVRKYISADLSDGMKREIYDGLKSGSIKGVISTNALEAGIDIGRLDACVIAGFPFWVMRMRQMAGRVGRSQEGLVLFVPQPMGSIDMFYRNHPNLLLTQPPEVFVVDPSNRYIARKHINAAANELQGLPTEDLRIFGENAVEIADQAIKDRVMEFRRNQYYGSRRNYADSSDPYAITGIRAQQQNPYVVCRSNYTPCQLTTKCFDGRALDACPGRITLLDQQYAYRDCHPMAIYEGQEGNFFRIVSLDDTQKWIKADEIAETPERTFVEDELDMEVLRELKAGKKIADSMEIHLGEVRVHRQFTGYYTYTLIPKRRCRVCRSVHDLNTFHCPACRRPTTRFFDQSKIERNDFPSPYERGFSMTLDTVACWLTVAPEVENRMERSSPCKLPGDKNRVKHFLQHPLSPENLTGGLRLSSVEAALVEKYYSEAGRAVRERGTTRKEAVLYPGVYAQCFLPYLRDHLEESRALEIFEKVTGYPVTNDLKHVCRKCQTSMLLPGMHTLEHTVRMRYPSIALGDSSDLGGHTALGHPQTGAPAIFWYDLYQGGLGAADKIFDQIVPLIEASTATLTGCTCTSIEGCPHCTQLSYCDEHNEALSKVAGLVLGGLLMGRDAQIPYTPFIYQSAQKARFDEESKANEYVSRPHGVGSERPESAAAEGAFDPYEVLRVQSQVHDPVLKKAYEVRSMEITQELPQISASDLNRAYDDILHKNRPSDWNIQPGASPYQVLEILPKASSGMLQRVYRVIAREVHPDIYRGDRDKANEMMKLVNAAYQSLLLVKKQKEA